VSLQQASSSSASQHQDLFLTSPFVSATTRSIDTTPQASEAAAPSATAASTSTTVCPWECVFRLALHVDPHPLGPLPTTVTSQLQSVSMPTASPDEGVNWYPALYHRRHDATGSGFAQPLGSLAGSSSLGPDRTGVSAVAVGSHIDVSVTDTLSTTTTEKTTAATDAETDTDPQTLTTSTHSHSADTGKTSTTTATPPSVYELEPDEFATGRESDSGRDPFKLSQNSPRLHPPPNRSWTLRPSNPALCLLRERFGTPSPPILLSSQSQDHVQQPLPVVSNASIASQGAGSAGGVPTAPNPPSSSTHHSLLAEPEDVSRHRSAEHHSLMSLAQSHWSTPRNLAPAEPTSCNLYLQTASYQGRAQYTKTTLLHLCVV
jgi:hypothetical protein